MMSVNIRLAVMSLFAAAIGLYGCTAQSDSAVASAPAAQSQRPNILFIAIDDLRPDLGTYGHPVAQTPNIDALAKSGLQFDQAFVSQAVCGPSRAALMTSLRPSTSGITTLKQSVEDTVPDAVTMSQMFKAAGYYTIGIGKIYHHSDDDMKGWTERPNDVISDIRKAARRNKEPRLAAVKAPDRSKLADTINVQTALNKMKTFGKSGEPFFMAVGIHRPHLPFEAPVSDWARYNPATIPGPINPNGQKNAPDYALVAYEIWAYDDTPTQKVGKISVEKADELRHAYLAAVSYADSLVGDLMAELKAQGLDENTIVVLWGDHGWKIADHGKWAKHSNAEIDIHIPLIIRAPGQTKAGSRTKALVETVDLYPTLAELSGLKAPTNNEGLSLVPLFSNPDRAWKEAAFAEYGRSVRGEGRVTGHTTRTARYRYTEWRTDGANKVIGIELYDLEKDPEESVNVAKNRNYASALKMVQGVSNKGWKGVRAAVK